MNFNKPLLTLLLISVVSLCSCTASIVTHLTPHNKTSSVNSTAAVSCTNSTTCGNNAFCNPSTKLCQCDLGFYKPGSNSSCAIAFCYSSTFCRLAVSLTTKCALDSHRCVCDDSFELDVATQTCRPVRLPRGNFCAFDLQCGAGAVCGQSTKNSQAKSCICKSGYLPADSNSLNCEPFTCTTNYDCTSTFPGNTGLSVCQGGSCACNAASGWSLNAANQSCISNRTPLNGSCTFDSDCGTGAVCGAGNKCACQLGYLPDTSGANINCQQYICSSDFDCSLHFKGVPHLTCQFGACKCDNANGWNLLPANQSCKPRSVPIGGNCIFDSDCGVNADCVSGACKCHFGDAVNSNGLDCSPLSCFFDSDCTAMDPNAECSFGDTCVCKDGFRQNFITQSCTADDRWDMGSVLAVFGLIMLGVFVLIGGVIVLIWAISRGGGSSRRRAAYIQKS